MSSEPDCSVVVVAWNAGDDLQRCLGSVEAGLGRLDAEVVVVDNGSADGSVAAARRQFPRISVLVTGGNLGFAAGANVGARAARGRHLVFLNPDAFLEPGALEAMVRFLDATPAVVGAALVNPDGSPQPSWGHFGPISHLLLDTRLPRWLHSRRRTRGPRSVDWVYGTCLALPRGLFVALGGFDERHSMYGEDLDLCYRARAAGFPTMWLPGARVVHLGNRSGARRFGPRREAEVVRAEMRFYAGRARRELLVFRVIGAAKFGLKTLVCLLALAPARAGVYARVVGACLFFHPRESGGPRAGSARFEERACQRRQSRLL